MATIWSRREAMEWVPRELSGEGLSLFSAIEPGPVEKPKGSAPTLRSHAGPHRTWTLFVPPGSSDVSVNGEAVRTGIRTLRDRDAIQFDDRGPAYFSTEQLARVTPCPETERAIFCARCKTLIEPGSPAVGCPRCSAWHHQTDTLNCWLYAERCALCPAPTDFDAGYSWRPEDL